jgi:hypothetical protein
MDPSDSIPLIFLTHFQEARLQEMQDLADISDTLDLQYFQATISNPQLIAEMDRQRQRVINAQLQLDRMVMQSSTNWSPAQIEDAIRYLEFYQSQTIISRWIKLCKSVNDLLTQVQYLRSQNELVQKQLTEPKKIKK